MLQVVGLKIYGATNLAVVNSVYKFALGDIKFVPECSTSKSITNKNVVHKGFGVVSYSFDSEVQIVIRYIPKDSCIAELKNRFEIALKQLTNYYTDFEPIHPVSVMLIGDSWKSIATNKSHLNMYQSFIGAFRGHDPLKVKDFKKAYHECFEAPSYDFQIKDPFIIEKRRILMNSIYDLARRIGITDWIMKIWLSSNEASKESFIECFADREVSEEITKRPDFDKLMDIINKMREEKDWIDPIMFF